MGNTIVQRPERVMGNDTMDDDYPITQMSFTRKLSKACVSPERKLYALMRKDAVAWLCIYDVEAFDASNIEKERSAFEREPRDLAEDSAASSSFDRDGSHRRGSTDSRPRRPRTSRAKAADPEPLREVKLTLKVNNVIGDMCWCRGYVYFTSFHLNFIIRTDPTTGKCEHFAGSIDGERGLVDGHGPLARFFHPIEISADNKNGLLYVADSDNQSIRSINVDTRLVKTLKLNYVEASHHPPPAKHPPMVDEPHPSMHRRFDSLSFYDSLHFSPSLAPIRQLDPSPSTGSGTGTGDADHRGAGGGGGSSSGGGATASQIQREFPHAREFTAEQANAWAMRTSLPPVEDISLGYLTDSTNATPPPPPINTRTGSATPSASDSHLPPASSSRHNPRSPSPHTASSSTNSAGLRPDDALPPPTRPTFHRSPSASASIRNFFSRSSDTKASTLPPRPPRARSTSPHPQLMQPVALSRTFSTPLVESESKENSVGGDSAEQPPRSSSRLSPLSFGTLSRSHKRSHTSSGPRSLKKRFSLRSFRRKSPRAGSPGIDSKSEESKEFKEDNASGRRNQNDNEPRSRSADYNEESKGQSSSSPRPVVTRHDASEEYMSYDAHLLNIPGADNEVPRFSHLPGSSLAPNPPPQAYGNPARGSGSSLHRRSATTSTALSLTRAASSDTALPTRGNSRRLSSGGSGGGNESGADYMRLSERHWPGHRSSSHHHRRRPSATRLQSDPLSASGGSGYSRRSDSNGHLRPPPSEFSSASASHSSDGHRRRAVDYDDMYSRAPPICPVGVLFSNGVLYFTSKAAVYSVEVADGSNIMRRICGGRMSGFYNGEAHKALFSMPRQMVEGFDGTLYIMDRFNFSIRVLSANRRWVSSVAPVGDEVPFDLVWSMWASNSRGHSLCILDDKGFIRGCCVRSGYDEDTIGALEESELAQLLPTDLVSLVVDFLWQNTITER